MHSMTGFGRGVSPCGHGQLVLEIKTVNHRFLEIRSRTPSELSGIETVIEKLIRKHLGRGHCSVHVSFESVRANACSLNSDVLCAHIQKLVPIAEQNGLLIKDLLPVLANAPDLFALPTFSDTKEVESAAKNAFKECIDKLLCMRRAEGEAMAQVISKKLGEIEHTVAQLSKLAEGYAESLFNRSQTRLMELLHNHSTDLDPSRLEAEVAILADKADINEEITRLSSHLNQMNTLLTSDKPIGRRMEFLIQEMGREANTIGSKASMAEITHLIVEFKGEIEKIRELVQNVE